MELLSLDWLGLTLELTLDLFPPMPMLQIIFMAISMLILTLVGVVGKALYYGIKIYFLVKREKRKDREEPHQE